MNRWTDRQTDRQGQILMAPDCRHVGIKKLYYAFETYVATHY